MNEPGNLPDKYLGLTESTGVSERKSDYTEYLDSLPSESRIREQANARKQTILDILGGDQEDWHDWRWQLKNRVRDSERLAQILGLGDLERQRIDRVGETYRWAISPYYLSLIGPELQDSPIYRQSVPTILELAPGGSLDPMNEAGTSPAPCVTRRYPDRLIINVTNQCAMYCRHCQRRRNIGEVDCHSGREDVAQALRYVASNPEIRDVLITGGDAFMLSDTMLDWILGELHQIRHVEIKRIGTRTPVTLPQRVTPELCQIIAHYPPVYVNLQFNHPQEITPEAKEACDRLVKAGAVLGNQAVLLRGVNDRPFVMKKLNQDLLRIRVRPYYIFHAKDVKGTRHFQTGIQDGMDIIRGLRGHTSGLAVPTYIVNAPGGLGKIPLMPNHILQVRKDKVVLKTWEGKIVTIENRVNDESEFTGNAT